MAVFGLFAAALLASWVALQTSAMNTTSYAQRQNDEMRVFDYLKRDIRRASSIGIYNGATLVTGTAFGTKLKLTVPDYYSDSREDDNTGGTSTANTPTLSGTTVSYGTALTVEYYTSSSGAVIRSESGIERTIADAAGNFAISFSRETSGKIRSRVLFDQRLRSANNRTIRRQVDVLAGQRTQLQL